MGSKNRSLNILTTLDAWETHPIVNFNCKGATKHDSDPTHFSMSRALLTIAAVYIALSHAHSWIDILECECPKTSGYPRNYQGREAIGRNFDLVMTHRIEGKSPAASSCSDTQLQQVYNPAFPQLSCPAGSKVTFRYNPNGHVTVDPNPNPKTWSIHWNKDGPIDTRSQLINGDELINYVSKDNPFDDTICGERNGRSGQPCTGSFIIPADATPKSYKFVWFWIFDRATGGAGEEYTTCFDINVLPATTTSCAATVNPVVQQPQPEVEPATTRVSTLSVATPPSGECKVSEGDKAVGISAYSDNTCPGLGCYDTNCRYCKTTDTPQSNHFLPCK